MNKYRIFLYFLSFLEGSSVMAAELLGAKMLSPYFGASLYVWSSVLAVTLGGLALGYFTGGIISEGKRRERNLYIILLASAVFLIMMPVLAKEIMVHTAGFGLLVSILISSLIFLFPPVFCMGMVSPLIVGCIASGHPPEIQNPGKTAGAVYAISTLGGILATFFLGFYCIPVWGLTKPAIIIGMILGIIPFIKLITKKKFFSLIFPLSAFFSFGSSKPAPANSDMKILYSSEGLLGQIIVADYPLYEGRNKVEGSQRILFVNRSTQTVVTKRKNEVSFFEYVHLISRITKLQIEDNRQALVLGLGGGSVANELTKNGFQVDAVELDFRIAEIAKKYFGLSDRVNVCIDDARHFLLSQKFNSDSHREKNQKYDVIVLDAFIGEVNPHHLFTEEFFAEIKSNLSDSGIFFINGNGYWNDKAGKGMRSVCKTLIHSGFDAEVVPTQEEEAYRNLVFIAGKSKENAGIITSKRIADLNLENAIILTDEKPQLEILNAEANKKWREACMNYFLNGYYSKQDMLLFE
ncbi:MAG: methyltransferase domain-containing protein [Bacteroidetes bacterium]|nr:MAG: methyltransferase domain-containing protein [Bacteroidota bacterium]